MDRISLSKSPPSFKGFSEELFVIQRNIAKKKRNVPFDNDGS